MWRRRPVWHETVGPGRNFPETAGITTSWCADRGSLGTGASASNLGSTGDTLRVCNGTTNWWVSIHSNINHFEPDTTWAMSKKTQNNWCVIFAQEIHRNYNQSKLRGRDSPFTGWSKNRCFEASEVVKGGAWDPSAVQVNVFWKGNPTFCGGLNKFMARNSTQVFLFEDCFSILSLFS